jgi:hypothetical protein
LLVSIKLRKDHRTLRTMKTGMRCGEDVPACPKASERIHLSILKIPTAKIFEPLLKPARYKGVYGGRGSGKLLVWDKVLGLGQTDGLAGFASVTANLVVSFYFAKRAFENVARIIKR